jgi:hypothetical protein
MHKIRLMFPLVMAVFISVSVIWLLREGVSVNAAPVTELHVCSSGCTYATIQSAVDAANMSDVIKVAQGTYNDMHHLSSMDTAGFTATQMVMINKQITLVGGYATSDWNTADPVAHPTILDAGGLGRVFVITDTTTPEVSGFYVTNGDSKGLGGMFWGDVGGAFYIKNASPQIRDNRIYNNTATYYGGGMYVLGSEAVIVNNDIFGNSTQHRGGGVYLDSSAVLFKGNEIRNNSTVNKGGGVCSFWSGADISNNIFKDNSSGYSGGGLLLYGNGNVVKNNLFENNSAELGGGIYLNYEFGDVPSLVNIVLVRNQAPEGSGIWFAGDQYSEDRYIPAIHTTLYDNRGGGEGIYIGEYASMVLTNTIITSHTVGVRVASGSSANLNETLWYANGTDRDGNVIHTNDYIGDPAFAHDGYHLTLYSPAINQGIDAGVAVDIDGDKRPLQGGFDLGADEFMGKIYLPMLMKG